MPPSEPSSNANPASPPVTADSASPADGRRKTLPKAVVVGLILVGILFGLIVFLQVFVARRIPELTESRLEAAEQRWEADGPDSYDMDLELRGARPGDVHVEVRGGQTVAMTRDGQTPSQRRTWSVWSVPGQFETIERELELAADPEHEMQAAAGTRLRLHAEFDPQYGFPRQFHRIVYGGGPEVYWRVTRFEPRTNTE